MPEQLHYTCPICPLGHLLEYDADCDDYVCQGCLLSAPGPVLARIGEGQQARGAAIALEALLESAKEALDPRAELARLKGVGVKFTEANQLRMLNAEMRDLAEDLRELANSAGTAAALADDTFDVLARDGYRGRALAYRAAAQRLEQLAGLEPPKAVGRG